MRPAASSAACPATAATRCWRRWPTPSSGARPRSCATTARTWRPPSAPTPPRRSSTGCCSTRTGWPTWPPASAPWPPCPTRSAPSTAAGAFPTGSTSCAAACPLGVIAVIYEGRPNVTADAVALCLKSGNAIILRGSHLAKRSNLIIAEVLTGALIEADAPRWSVALLGSDREELRQLIQMEGAARPGHPARRRVAQGLPQGARPRAGDLRRLGQQPRVRARRRRPRDGRQDHGQRQGAAPGRVQRRRDPARAQRRRPGGAAPGGRPPGRPGRDPARQPRRARHPGRGRRRAGRGHRRSTTPPSSSTW